MNVRLKKQEERLRTASANPFQCPWEDPVYEALMGPRLAYVQDCEQLALEYLKLSTEVRKHRDFRGDHRCWQDDEDLYKTLPEGYTPPERTEAVEIGNCHLFIVCRRNPNTTYISPQTRIEELEKLLAECPIALMDRRWPGSDWLDKRKKLLEKSK